MSYGSLEWFYWFNVKSWMWIKLLKTIRYFWNIRRQI